MNEVARFRRLFEYDAWANAATLTSLRVGPAPEKARAWMAHIIGSERLWLARLRQEPSGMPVWPDLDLEACGAQITGLLADWTRYLEELDEDGLADGVAYRNSKGEFWTSSAGDIDNDSPELSKPAVLAGSTGNSRVGCMSTPVRSRMV